MRNLCVTVAAFWLEIVETAVGLGYRHHGDISGMDRLGFNHHLDVVSNETQTCLHPVTATRERDA